MSQCPGEVACFTFHDEEKIWVVEQLGKLEGETMKLESSECFDQCLRINIFKETLHKFLTH
jgi:hypothetical protein